MLFHERVANFKRSEHVLIIDEAENLTTKSLELIRRLFDFSQVPVVLIGTYTLL
ncbi:ATP-binding protein [Abyssogena phaseoliformis symbiont]|uniref:AAA family ATPase n=1 Tax=Abyssogena phaseoliformis symbiont TaxID=596095 RepID=UPI001915435E